MSFNIEGKTYETKSQRDQIILRPTQYIGDITRKTYEIYTYDNGKLVLKNVNFSDAYKRIFDEILTNATDHYFNNGKVKNIWVNVQKDSISIKNDGTGIPIELTDNIYLPERIYTVLNTSSNYDDSIGRIGGGVNGQGAKLTGLFSSKIIIDIVWKGKRYQQTVTDRLLNKTVPIITDVNCEDYTSYTYYPLFDVFGMSENDVETFNLLYKRCIDVICVTDGNVNIHFNGTKITISNYFNLYSSYEIIQLDKSDKWRVYVSILEGHNISFINGVDIRENGEHMNYVHKIIRNIASDKFKNLGNTSIKDLYSVYMVGNIINPHLDGQMKVKLMNIKNEDLPQLNTSGLAKLFDDGLSELIMKKISQKKTIVYEKKEKIDIMVKHTRAADYGKKNNGCYLIITEGDSAKSSFVTALGGFGKDLSRKIGIFPIRGKFLNVSKLDKSDKIDNLEVKALIDIIGLDINNNYNNVEDINNLKYSGGIIIAADQDPDGSHIKGLLIYFFYKFFPGLLKCNNFIYEFTTPLIKTIKGKGKNLTEQWFFTKKEFEKADVKGYDIKYCKGLGSSGSKEFYSYTSRFKELIISFKWDDNSGKMIELAFSKDINSAYNRKEWLMTQYNENLEPIYKENDKDDEIANRLITYSDFINLELIHFAFYDNTRKIPGIDGLKTVQRKAIWVMKSKSKKTMTKVSQFANEVAEKMSYHHGEKSLIDAVQHMCKNYVGSNNLPLLEGEGQFGNRVNHKPADGRYTFVKKPEYFNYIFRKEDDIILELRNDDGAIVEPKYLLPILPSALFNPIEGIGFGVSTNYVPYSIKQMIQYIKNRLTTGYYDENDPTPCYKGFKGTTYCQNNKSVFVGDFQLVDNNIIIKELPPQKSIEKFEKYILENDPNAKFTYDITNGEKHPQDQGLIIKIKLKTPLEIINDESKQLDNINSIDENGKLIEYNTICDYIESYVELRLAKYDERKDKMLKKYAEEMLKLENKIKFIENFDKSLVGKKHDDIVKYYSNIIKDIEHCDYLFDMKMINISKEKIQTLKDEIAELIEKIKMLENKKNTDIWIEELNELENVLEKCKMI